MWIVFRFIMWRVLRRDTQKTYHKCDARSILQSQCIIILKKKNNIVYAVLVQRHNVQNLRRADLGCDVHSVLIIRVAFYFCEFRHRNRSHHSIPSRFPHHISILSLINNFTILVYSWKFFNWILWKNNVILLVLF